MSSAPIGIQQQNQAANLDPNNQSSGSPNQQNFSAADYSAQNFSPDQLAQFAPEPLPNNLNQLNVQFPKQQGSVTNGITNSGAFTQTVNNGQGVTATSTRNQIGDDPKVTNVTATIPVNPNANVVTTLTPTAASLGGNVTTPLGNNWNATLSGSVTQPLNGSQSTAQFGASVQQGNSPNGARVGGNVYTGANPGFDANVRVPLGNSASLGASYSNRDLDTVSANLNVNINPNLSVGAGYTNNLTTGEQTGTVRMQFSH